MIKSIIWIFNKLNNKPSLITIGALFFLLIIYMGISLYITSLSYKTIINLPDETPEKYGLNYEEIEFPSAGEDRLTLRGWWIPGQSKNTIIYLHGIDGNRASHLEILSEFNKMGYSILTFDLRGHGLSDKSKVGLGVKEIPDVKGAINYLENNRDVKQVALYGVSYGATMAILVAKQDSRIKGIYIDSSYNMIVDLLTGEVPRRTPIPSFIASLLSRGIVLSSIMLEGINFDSITPAEDIQSLSYPVLMVHCEDDDRIPIYHSDQIHENAPQDTLYHKFENCGGHANSWKTHRQYYLGFAETYFNRVFN